MIITYHGHSCIQIRNELTSIIIDPFITGNPLAKTKVEEIKVDYILVTHGHNDHLGDTIEIAKLNNATVITTDELATYLTWKGLKVHPMHIGGAYNFDFGKVKMTPAFHGSSVTLYDSNQIIYTGMPAGFIIELDEYTLYHAGDTALFSDIRLIGDRNKIDFAFLPIGDNFTMGPEDAVLAGIWAKAKTIIPIHYNTFPIIQQDINQVKKLFNNSEVDLKVMEIGQSIELPYKKECL